MLDHMLNEQLDEVEAFRVQAQRTIKILQENKLSFYRFPPLKITEGLTLELKSLDLINRYVSYKTTITRLNSDLASLNHMFTRFEDIQIAGRPFAPENIVFAVKTLEELNPVLKAVITKIEELLVITRIHLRKINEQKNPLLYALLHREYTFSISEEEITSEEAKLKAEIEFVRTKENTFFRKQGIEPDESI